MVAMGTTLTPADFKRVARNPTVVLFGVLCQFVLMPLSAMSAGRFFKLPPSLFLGLVLVGTAPGGTASNLVTLIAGGDVALSVLMTATSTVAASLLTPLLATTIAGSTIAVNGAALFKSTSQVVLLPIALGMFLNAKAPVLSNNLARYTPFLSVVLVSLVCGSVVAANSTTILSSGLPLLLSVLTLHSSGFLLGYSLPRFFKFPKRTARTISIETGMQNSALAVVLANSLGNPAAAIPGAISATVHSCLGSLLAGVWRAQDNKAAPPPTQTTDYCLNINLHVKPERRAEFLSCIEQNAAGTRVGEPLAICYEWGESATDPNHFHFHERYQGKEGFEAHTKTEHFAAWEKFTATDPFEKEPEVVFFKRN